MDNDEQSICHIKAGGFWCLKGQVLQETFQTLMNSNPSNLTGQKTSLAPDFASVLNLSCTESECVEPLVKKSCCSATTCLHAPLVGSKNENVSLIACSLCVVQGMKRIVE